MSVLVESDGPVTIVTIDRPARRNAVDPDTAVALRNAFTAFAADKNARVAILTGSEGHFCAGFDLNAVETSRYDPDGPGPMGPTRMLLEKPVIAAVEGHAVAGGLELALWCDLRVAAESAVFGVYCRRWGVPLIDGGTVRLPRIVGQGRASDLLYTGRSLGGEEAHQWGFFNRLAEPHALEAEAVTWAAEIAAGPNFAHAMTKRMLHQEWTMGVDEAIEAEAQAQAICMMTQDFHRAYHAFVAKQRPEFKGD